MEGLEPSYRKHAKAMGVACKHCKSMAHGTLQHGKHYKSFHEEKKAEREERAMKHMKAFEGTKRDNDRDVKEGSKEDEKRDREEMKHGKALPKTYRGKSTKLGHGGRAAKLHDELPGSMPESEKGAIIGKIARSKGAAPGGPNYHGKHKKGMSEADAGDMSHYRPVNTSRPVRGLQDNSHAVGGSHFGGSLPKMAKRMPKKV